MMFCCRYCTCIIINSVDVIATASTATGVDDDRGFFSQRSRRGILSFLLLIFIVCIYQSSLFPPPPPPVVGHLCAF